MLRSLVLVGCLLGAPAVSLAAEYDTAAILAAARAADDAYQRHVEELATHLKSADQPTRAEAMLVIGHLEDRTLVPMLLPFLEITSEPADAISAAMALGHIGDSAATPPLRDLLARARDAQEREAALNALEQIKATNAIDYSSKVKDSDPPINGSALTNLGTLAHAPAVDVLAWGLVHDRRQVIRRMCAIGIGRIGDRNQGPNLQDALGDADPGVRRYAAEALVKLDYKPAIPYLLMALEGNAAGAYIDRCLRMLSGQDFGFDWRANEMARKEAVERGFRWWTDHAAELSR
jgi:HEAT repeat protein